MLNQEDNVVELRPDVLAKLNEDVQSLQEKYEFERHENETWLRVVQKHGLSSPLQLDMYLKGINPTNGFPLTTGVSDNA